MNRNKKQHKKSQIKVVEESKKISFSSLRPEIKVEAPNTEENPIKIEPDLPSQHLSPDRKDPKGLKILWYSVSPHIKSGYGIVTNFVVNGFLDRGWNTVIAAYYGIETGGFLKFKDLIVLPVDRDPNNDKYGFLSTKEHFTKFKRDICIYHTDFWISEELTKLIEDIYCYTPIDHENYPDAYQNVFKRYKQCLVPSLHGQRELKKYGIDTEYIPHGVATNIFHPLDKKECREYFNMKQEWYVVGIVAANSDREPRKGWDAMFQAIEIFLRKFPEAKENFKVMIHTHPKDRRGYNLFGLAKSLGIDKYCTFQDPYMAILGLPSEMMARMYNTMDVLMNLASREGYCLPMVEAEACGVPCITTNFSAMIERVNNGKCGWLVQPHGLRLSPLNAFTAIPNAEGCVKALEEAYFDREKLKKFSKKSIEWAQTFDWNRVIDNYWVPWLEKIAKEYGYGEISKESLAERKILEV